VVSDATTILAAVKAVIETVVDPLATPVIVRKREAAADASPRSGWAVGDPSTCWVLSMSRADKVSARSVFTHNSVDYRVTIDFVRPYLPGEDDDDEATRAAKSKIRSALYVVNLAGAPQVIGAPVWEEGDPYKQSVAGDLMLWVSTQTATFRVFEPRP